MQIPEFERMNQAQAQAVRHVDGPALILAGPGSGKTFVIINRLLYLTEQCHIPPESILVITFTKAAALSMQKRFLTSINGRVLPVCFGTFHSVFFHILQQYTGYDGRSILTNGDKKSILVPILQAHRAELRETFGSGNGEYETNGESVARMLSLISLYKNNPEAVVDGFLKELPFPLFEKLLGAYQDRLDTTGKLDFDDMIGKCRHLLTHNPKVLEQCRQRFRYIMIDEFQDCNSMQYSTISLLAAPRHNLFVVGDDDQSIYGFRGADPGIMRQFTADYPQGELLLLNVNYRSVEPVVAAACKVIAQNKNRFDKALSAAGTAVGGRMPAAGIFQQGQDTCMGVVCRGFPDKETEYRHMTDRILQWKERIPLEEMAVIFRTNKEMERPAEQLRKAGIPCRAAEAGQSIYEHFVAADIVQSILFALGQRTYLPAVFSFLQKSEQDARRLAELPPYTAVHYMRKLLGYDIYLTRKAAGNEERRREWLARAEELQEEAKGYLSLAAWLQEIDSRREMWENTRQEKGNKEGLWLLTMHAAKGLEYTYVCLPDVNEGVIPHGRNVSAEDAEEERRIFYVGMTRAKTALDILYLTGTKEYPRLPSRFLNPILCR